MTPVIALVAPPSDKLVVLSPDQRHPSGTAGRMSVTVAETAASPDTGKARPLER